MRYVTIFILFLLTASVFGLHFYKPEKEHSYKVVKVVHADEFYVDFNHDLVPNEDEIVKLTAIQTFRPEHKQFFLKRGFSAVEFAQLSYLADEFAKEKLLNKNVSVTLVSKNPKIGYVFLNNQDWSEVLIKSGYAFADKTKFDFYKYSDFEDVFLLKNNVLSAKNLDLVLLNQSSGKYHKLDCKYGATSRFYRIVRLGDLGKSSKKCSYCFKCNYCDELGLVEGDDPKGQKFGKIEVFYLDFLKHPKPNTLCKNHACKSLVSLINNAKSSIDAAVYGVGKQPQIFNALLNAQNRGVKVRIVVDYAYETDYSFEDTKKLLKFFPDVKMDDNEYFDLEKKTKVPTKFKKALMHNKFFIFDNRFVYTGSANLTKTDMSGFNSNIALILDSAQIARIYKNEFDQMFNSKFHYIKEKIENKENIYLENGTVVDIYFSPKDAVIRSKIIPLIENAKKYIYVPAFMITHKELSKALVQAKKRGVDVRIILDATSACNKYSVHEELRTQGIFVKVENRPGKMHMKSMIIDDEISVVGSMNFTASGDAINDENVLIIKNIAFAKSYKTHFLYLWKEIPDKWLYKNPHAESIDSPGSCCDGIDNDFDGETDKEDSGCFFIK